jgi:hypothetical protein
MTWIWTFYRSAFWQRLFNRGFLTDPILLRGLSLAAAFLTEPTLLRGLSLAAAGASLFQSQPCLRSLSLAASFLTEPALMRSLSLAAAGASLIRFKFFLF